LQTPQLENGYTKIANEIMDALIAFRIPGEERQCLDFILRKTYGYNKKEDIISNSQFVKATGLHKASVHRSIKSLIEKNIVSKIANNYIPTYRFNKNYKTWKVLAKVQPVSKSATAVSRSANKVLAEVLPTKERNTTIQKKAVKKFIPPSLAEVIKYFFEKGYSVESAKKAHEYYSTADWHDRNGNKVRNWKQKMIAVWFKDENKAPVQTLQKPLTMEDVKNGKLEKNG